MFQLRTMILAAAILFLAAAPAFAAEINASDLIDLTNEARAELGLKALSPNHKLTQAAYRKAQNILENGYFAHTNPSGKPFYQWVEEEGYNYLYAGENLAIDFNTSEGVAGAWLASPSHRANITNEHYDEIGLVALRGRWQDRETTVVVQMFGSLLRSSPTVLGQTLESLASSLKLRQDDLGSLAADIVLLPSLAGRKYFDVIAQADKSVGLSFSNPTAESIAASPITKVDQSGYYRTLLQSESGCCQNQTVFALTAENEGGRLTMPIRYPSLPELWLHLPKPSWPIPKMPSDLAGNMALAAVASLLLLYTYRKEILAHLRHPSSFGVTGK